MKRYVKLMLMLLGIAFALFSGISSDTYAKTNDIVMHISGKTVKSLTAEKKASIKLNKTKATIYTIGKRTIKLRAAVNGAGGKVTWISSNRNVATVKPNGLVTAKRAGKVTIIAKANGLTAKCTISVKVKKAKVKSKVNTVKAKALNAYKKMLSLNTELRKHMSEYDSVKDIKFSLVYIDDDTIPELLLYNAVSLEHMYLYTYQNGKIVDVDVFVSFAVPEFGYYKGKGVYWNKEFRPEVDIDCYMTYHMLSKGKTQYIGQKQLLLDKVKSYWWKNGKVSKSIFDDLLFEKVGKAGSITVKSYWKNTEANREKYIR